MTIQNRRRFLKATGAVASGGLLAGCTGGTTGSNGDDDSLNVLVTYFPDMVFSPLTGAKAFGYFDEMGLDVTIDTNLEVQNPLQILTGGQYDIVFATPFTYTTALARGVPVETVFTTIGNTPLSYATAADSGISGVEDWPGNVLGLQNEADRNWVTPQIFDDVGLSDGQVDDITQQFIGYSVTNITEGNVDVMSLYPTNSDYNSLRLAGKEFNLVEAKDFTNAGGNCALTTEQFATEHSETLTKFTRAWAKACQESLNPDNKERFAEMTLEQLEQADADVFLGDVDPMEVEKSNFEQFLEYRPDNTWDANGVGYSDPADYVEVQELGVKAGAISSDATTAEDDIVDNQFVTEVHDSNGNLEW